MYFSLFLGTVTLYSIFSDSPKKRLSSAIVILPLKSRYYFFYVLHYNGFPSLFEDLLHYLYQSLMPRLQFQNYLTLRHFPVTLIFQKVEISDAVHTPPVSPLAKISLQNLPSTASSVCYSDKKIKEKPPHTSVHLLHLLTLRSLFQNLQQVQSY